MYKVCAAAPTPKSPRFATSIPDGLNAPSRARIRPGETAPLDQLITSASAIIKSESIDNRGRQKLSFIASWICRIGVLYSRLEITPAVAVPMVEPGAAKCGWFSALNISTLN